MSRLCVVTPQVRSAFVSAWGLAALVLITSLQPRGQSQEAGNAASLHGIVRNSEGKPVAGVIIHLLADGSTWTQAIRTDLEGTYTFVALQSGVYVLRAEMSGYSDAEIPALFVGPKEVKHVDLILLTAKSPPSQTAAAQAPEFFDQPKFAVAGVTDTTNLGGHGSDTVVRTRETIAKETAALTKATVTEELVATSEKEKSLRERLDRDPRSFETNHLLGRMLDENGKARDAITYLARAGEINPVDYENCYDLALANAHAGNYERARESARALIAYRESAAGRC
jgi:hypothetical protein